MAAPFAGAVAPFVGAVIAGCPGGAEAAGRCFSAGYPCGAAGPDTLE